MLSVNMTPLANWTLMCSLEKQAVRYLFPSVVLMVSCIFFFCLSVPDVMLIKIIIIIINKIINIIIINLRLQCN